MRTGESLVILGTSAGQKILGRDVDKAPSIWIGNKSEKSFSAVALLVNTMRIPFIFIVAFSSLILLYFTILGEMKVISTGISSRSIRLHNCLRNEVITSN